jgi:hypothetical protein
VEHWNTEETHCTLAAPPPPSFNHHQRTKHKNARTEWISAIGTENWREEPGTSVLLRAPQRLTAHSLRSQETEETNGLARRAGDRAAEIGVQRTPPLLSTTANHLLSISRKAAEAPRCPNSSQLARLLGLLGLEVAQTS